MVQSSSSVQHHEFLHVLSQPFSCSGKGNRHVEENSRKEDGRRTCGSQAEVSLFEFKKPEQRANLFLRSGCYHCPGESAAGFRICAKKFLGNCSKEVAENCSTGIAEWLEDFTENLGIVETLAAAEIFHDPDPERPIKVA